MDRRNFCRIAALSLGAFGFSRLAIAAPIPDFAGLERMPRSCRAKVLRRECYIDLQAEHLDDPEAGPCPCFSTGDTLTFSAGEPCPPDFCPSLWMAITSRLRAGSCAGSAPLKDGRYVISCPDGTRPLVILLEDV